MLVLEVRCAKPNGADIATKYYKHGTCKPSCLQNVFFRAVSESLSDNMSEGSMRNKLSVMLEEEDEKKKNTRKRKLSLSIFHFSMTDVSTYLNFDII
jgi:hypothetical protein